MLPSIANSSCVPLYSLSSPIFSLHSCQSGYCPHNSIKTTLVKVIHNLDMTKSTVTQSSSYLTHEHHKTEVITPCSLEHFSQLASGHPPHGFPPTSTVTPSKPLLLVPFHLLMTLNTRRFQGSVFFFIYIDSCSIEPSQWKLSISPPSNMVFWTVQP